MPCGDPRRRPYAGAVSGSVISAARSSHVLIMGWDGARDDAVLPTIGLRRDGYLRALASRGIDIDEDLIRIEGFGRDVGYASTHALMEEHPDVTAIFAVNDTIASGVYDALGDAGLRILTDASVVAYDDTPLAANLSPKLTTVHVPLEQLGQEALRAAIDEPDAFSRTPEQGLTLGTYLVHRDSVAMPPR